MAGRSPGRAAHADDDPDFDPGLDLRVEFGHGLVIPHLVGGLEFDLAPVEHHPELGLDRLGDVNVDHRAIELAGLASSSSDLDDPRLQPGRGGPGIRQLGLDLVPLALALSPYLRLRSGPGRLGQMAG